MPPVFEHRTLSDDDMASVRRALELTLKHHEPYPAIVLDRQWNTLLRNQAAERLMAVLGPPDEVWQRVDPSGRQNVLRLSFHPQGLRPLVRNWEQVAPLTPTVNVEMTLGDLTLRVFSLLSTFGTAQDVTTDELRIETFFPADEVTATFFQSLAP